MEMEHSRFWFNTEHYYYNHYYYYDYYYSYMTWKWSTDDFGGTPSTNFNMSLNTLLML